MKVILYSWEKDVDRFIKDDNVVQIRVSNTDTRGGFGFTGRDGWVGRLVDLPTYNPEGE